jgi:uncharacterized ParB-like nuclease family protein
MERGFDMLKIKLPTFMNSMTGDRATSDCSLECSLALVSSGDSAGSVTVAVTSKEDTLDAVE